MTTSPPQPPQNPYPGQPGGYGPPPEQFPQYTQPPGQPQHQPMPQGQPMQQSRPQQTPPYQQQSFPQQAPAQQTQPYQQQSFAQQAPPQQGQTFPQQGQFQQQGQQGQHPQHQAQFPQQGQPQQQGQPMQQGGLQCRFCGGFPAVQATVRGHQGMIIMMRFLKLQGPFCRTCGTASVRDMTSKSLWQGWWGIGSMIINPITMLMNLEPWSKFKKLPEPAPGAPGRPMSPGKPLIQRPAMLMLLLPIALIVAIVVINLNITTASEASVGSCVVNKGTASNPNVEVVDCGSSEAEYKVVGKLDNTTDDSKCDQFEGYEAAYTSEAGSQKYTLCLGPI